MENVLIVIHLIVVAALVGTVLLQRSEGGGLGIGGGSGFMTARGAANALTRTTAILAAAFFATSLLLSILARYGDRPTDILDRSPAAQGQEQQGGGVLNQLGGVPADGAKGTGTAPAVVPGTPAQPAQTDGGVAVPAAPEGTVAPAQPVQPAVPAVPDSQ
jgi:preprotein translocase subunit SecG